jgi:hypothetical protein
VPVTFTSLARSFAGGVASQLGLPLSAARGGQAPPGAARSVRRGGKVTGAFLSIDRLSRADRRGTPLRLGAALFPFLFGSV